MEINSTSEINTTTVPTPTLTTQIVVHQDNYAFPNNIILNEMNFSLWSQLMEMRIGARNKGGFLTGATVKPEISDPYLESWIIENHRVKSWLIDSMTTSLMQRFI